MSRIPLADVATLTGPRRAQYDRFPSNLTRVLLLLDDRLAGVLPESANALRSAGLAPAWREAIILRVAALQNSAYERFQHLAQARAAGLTDHQIAGIEAGRFGDLDAGLVAVLAFTDQCTEGPDVTDAAFAAARTVLTDRQLVTVIVLVGHYLTVARLTGILQVDLDERADDFSHDH